MTKFDKLFNTIMEEVKSSKKQVIKESAFDYQPDVKANITKQDWEEVKKELEPYFINHLKQIGWWREGDEEWNNFLLKDLGDTDPAHDYLPYTKNWKEWDRETLKKRWMGRINQINDKWMNKLSLPFDLKDAQARADRYWEEMKALPEKVKNMSKEQVEESMQKITAALEEDSDWKKGDDGKWEYDGYHTAAEEIAKVCENCLPIDIDCFEDYWNASDEVARLEYIEENGDDEDFEVDETGCGYDEWITEFEEYICVGWLKDFLDSIIEW